MRSRSRSRSRAPEIDHSLIEAYQPLPSMHSRERVQAEKSRLLLKRVNPALNQSNALPIQRQNASNQRPTDPRLRIPIAQAQQQRQIHNQSNGFSESLYSWANAPPTNRLSSSFGNSMQTPRTSNTLTVNNHSHQQQQPRTMHQLNGRQSVPQFVNVPSPPPQSATLEDDEVLPPSLLQDHDNSAYEQPPVKRQRAHTQIFTYNNDTSGKNNNWIDTQRALANDIRANFVETNRKKELCSRIGREFKRTLETIIQLLDQQR